MWNGHRKINRIKLHVIIATLKATIVHQTRKDITDDHTRKGKFTHHSFDVSV